MRYLICIATPLIMSWTTAIKLDPDILCPVEYDEDQLNQTIQTLKNTASDWDEKTQMIIADDQVGIFKDRPIFRTKGATLKDHLKSCTEKDGVLLEIFSKEDMTKVREVMKKTGMQDLLIHILLRGEFVVWASSGAALDLENIDNVLAIAKKDGFTNMLKVKLWNADFDRAMLSYYEIPDQNIAKGLSGLCLMNDNTLLDDMNEFNDYAKKVVNDIIQGKYGIDDQHQEMLGFTKQKGSDEGCMKIAVEPIEEVSFEEPLEKVANKGDFREQRAKFTKFIEKIKKIKGILRKTVKMMKTANNIDPEIVTFGTIYNFFKNFSFNNRAYIFIFVTMMVSAITACSTCICCQKYIKEKRKPAKIRESYARYEDIPLAKRRLYRGEQEEDSSRKKKSILKLI